MCWNRLFGRKKFNNAGEVIMEASLNVEKWVSKLNFNGKSNADLLKVYYEHKIFSDYLEFCLKKDAGFKKVMDEVEEALKLRKEIFEEMM